MKAFEEQHTILGMCKALEVSSSGYSCYRQRLEHGSDRALRDAELKGLIEEIHEKSDSNYGSPRVFLALQWLGESCGRKRVERLMRELGLFGVQKRAFKPRTTDSNHKNRISPNLRKQRPFPTQMNETWVTDTTCISVREGWLYLAVVMDLFNREIIGWATSVHNDTDLVLKAMDNAIAGVGTPHVHHSDRGSTYTSNAYLKLLSDYGVLSSMSAKGYCYDNAHVESFFSTLKSESQIELLKLDQEAATQKLFEFIESYYNTYRIHTALGCSPREFASWSELGSCQADRVVPRQSPVRVNSNFRPRVNPSSNL